MTMSSSSFGILVLTASAVLFGTTLVLATAWSQSPLDRLGLRPHGRDLWSWLWNYCGCCGGGGSGGSGGGVAGYDCIQGALSPPLRLACHLSAVLALWSVVLLLMPPEVMEDATDMLTLPTITSLLLSTVLYTTAMYIVHHVMPAVSMPGGPRPHKIQRQPEWPTNKVVLDPSLVRGYTCLVAQDSHQATARKFMDDGTKMTGEPAGRQAWFKLSGNAGDGSGGVSDNISQPQQDDNSSSTGGGGGPVAFLSSLLSPRNNNNGVDEALVQRLARGGRDEDYLDSSQENGYVFCPSRNPNSNDQIFRAQQIRKYLSKPGATAPDLSTQPSTVDEACRKAAHFYSMLQCEDGHWAADYGGPHFLMPGLVTAWYVMGKPDQLLDADQIALLRHYILAHQQVDGGWGTHIESPSTMFGSTLMYVALRLMGTPSDHPACVKGRSFLQQHGGALYTSSWSKFYLCLLGLMDWRGHNSVPPEMWLLPNWFPFHPGRMWCHARMVYLPMGYLYGNRFVYPQAETDATILALREEIYCSTDGAFESIPWSKTRHWIASTDNYSPIPWVMKILQNLLARYEEWSIFQPFKQYVRQQGLDFSLEYMNAEDLQTNYIDIGPVNKVLNMISHYYATEGNLKDDKLVQHMMRVQDYLWVAEDGMKMQGYNGSQCWDTSFCAQALFESDVLDDFPETTRKLWSYLERTQILSTEVSHASPAYRYESNEYRQKFYRHISEGGWPFSTSAHGWPISDCTSEGLKAVLCLLKTKTVQAALQKPEDVASHKVLPISNERLYKAVNVLLTYQNEDGGWATYENNRGWGWYEQLNPSEVFGDIMIDYSYVECSMASLTALVDFAEVFPEHRTEDIQHSIDKGRAFLKRIQRSDGSWYGSWACCFCYGIWFGVEGLIKCGEKLDSPSISKACDFLLRHQRPNGGWGEDFTSCYDKDYAKEGMQAYGDEGSGVVNTAWALLALSMAQCKDVDAIRHGVKYLTSRQLPSGDWPQEGISGVFNRSVGITYTAYRNVFPMWALGRCLHVYGDALDTNAAPTSATMAPTEAIGKED